MGKVDPGKRFEHDFHQSLNRLSGYALRVFDGAAVAKHKMPGDFIYWNPAGESFLIECKATRKRTFPASQLKPHQLESLLKFENLSSMTGAVIALNFYGDDLSKQNRCILLPAWKYAVYLAKEARKSLPLEDAVKIGVECPRITGGVWNLKQAFERTVHVKSR